MVHYSDRILLTYIYIISLSTHSWWLVWTLPFPQSLDHSLSYLESGHHLKRWQHSRSQWVSVGHQSPGSKAAAVSLSPRLLMTMAMMTGVQADFRTSLTGGEWQAMVTQAGMRSNQKTHTHHRRKAPHVCRATEHRINWYRWVKCKQGFRIERMWRWYERVKTAGWG